MAHSIFYEAGCRAALVKLGAYPEPSGLGEPLNPWPAIAGHALAGGALGAGAGALFGKSPKSAIGGGIAGALAGGGAKRLSSMYRDLQLGELENAVRADVKEMNELPPKAPDESDLDYWEHAAPIEDDYNFAMNAYNTRAPGLKSRITGWKY